MAEKSVLKDLTNQTFGRLKVLSRVEDYISPNGRHDAQWLCQCECGKTKVIRGSSLKNNLTKSCGCLRQEKSIQRLVMCNKKYNTYDLSGEYGIGYSEDGNVFYFDLEDYDKIKDGYWNYTSSDDHHIRGHIYGIKTSLHRVIMGADNKNLVVDHINTHHPEDNRKCNLRIVTQSENQMNRKRAKNNTSGTTGVSWSTRDKRWLASLKVDGKNIYYKSFANKDDAITARINAEEKYFGEHSYNNSIKQWEENCIDLSR